MKFGWNQYWKPTPKGIRKFADSLSAASLAVSTYSFVNDYKAVAVVVLIAAGVAKFLSNFFAEDTTTPKP
jgi:hypothetical protein